MSESEREIEAILFAAEEPLDIESIQEKLKTRTNINKIIESKSKVNPSKINKNDYSISDISVGDIVKLAQELLRVSK